MQSFVVILPSTLNKQFVQVETTTGHSINRDYGELLSSINRRGTSTRAS